MEKILKSSNPFTGTYILKIVRVHVETQSIPRSDGYGLQVSNQFYDIEQQNKVSVYEDEILNNLLYTEATPSTLKLYIYICNTLLKKNTDYIIIDPTEVQNVLNIARKTLYTAITQLCDYKVITRKTGRNQYWINTEYLYNGNRIEYIKTLAPDCVQIVHQRRQKVY